MDNNFKKLYKKGFNGKKVCFMKKKLHVAIHGFS